MYELWGVQSVDQVSVATVFCTQTVQIPRKDVYFKLKNRRFTLAKR